MVKKLSELKNEDMLIIKNTGSRDIVLSKGELVENLDHYRKRSDNLGENIYTTIQYKANIQAWDMLEIAIDNESENMYECWDFDIKRVITDDDIEEIQNVIDRILSKGSNISYIENEKVEFDL
ncbi:GTP-binding protein [Clostridium perfringens]|uniref:GTP-binding protein n=1 Tax=Clostridium perfringens TaxID=1502 RepID=UPI0022486362|nr:GTP-binding protein [Clostridium perfringens]EGT0000333.1 GTP-binding protein [Clostridium perfringens]MCX0355151.1 GTP-binding protein [Clostridium perfringens]